MSPGKRMKPFTAFFGPKWTQGAATIAIGGTMALLLLTGCAVRFGNPRTGVEQIWGLGSLRMQTNACGTNMITITSGSLVPGICLNLGAESFGGSFGLVQRQWIVTTSGESDALAFPRARGLTFRKDAESLWAFGFSSLRGVSRL